jgi:hypothetical protein
VQNVPEINQVRGKLIPGPDQCAWMLLASFNASEYAKAV